MYKTTPNISKAKTQTLFGNSHQRSKGSKESKRPIKNNSADEKLLRFAARYNDIAFAMQLLFDGANVNAQSTKDGQTALHIAARKGHMLMVALLLNHNADVKLRDSKGMTPLSYAIENTDAPVIELLLDMIEDDTVYVMNTDKVEDESVINGDEDYTFSTIPEDNELRQFKM